MEYNRQASHNQLCAGKEVSVTTAHNRLYCQLCADKKVSVTAEYNRL